MSNFKNFAEARVVTAPSPALSGLSLTLTTGKGARFPASDFYLTIGPHSTPRTLDNSEVVHVLTRTGDVCTIDLRAQRGTTARAVIVGDDVSQDFLKEDIDALETLIAAMLPINLASQVTGRLPLANVVAASAASRLLGRRSGSAGDFEELTVGNSLAFTSTVLDTIQDIRTSASPTFTGMTVSGNAFTVGTQGSATTKNLRIAHQEPGGANPAAYFGIQSQTFTWTNGPGSSTYYDNTGFYGWNPGLAQADEASVGIAMESKYTNDSLNFQCEIYAAASFPDNTSVRPFGASIRRDAPHLTQVQICGDTFFTSSSTAVAAVTNVHIKEGGGVEMFNGWPLYMFNFASGASNTGKGQINIVPSDVNPAVSFLLSGAGRADIGANLTNGAIVAEVGYITGGYFLVNHGFGYIYQNSTTLQAFKIQNSGPTGGDFCFFTNDGTNARFRITNVGDIVMVGVNSQASNIKQVTTTLTGMSGATVTASNLIPAGSLVIGITLRVTTLITGATTFTIGDGTTANRWGTGIALAAGTTVTLADAVTLTPAIYPSATSVVLTATGSNFTAGGVRVTVHYISLTGPTS